ncbi:MAG: conserved rane protein of unknown function [Cytophagaceae bacterium]|jgi:membrane associated rhomboid family serine protease|nr:conserved rane protein of unknown function [Cytophagaceae bacterium]
MKETGFIGLILIGINAVVSYQGFKDYKYLDKYSFKTSKIVGDKDYKRLITSGFLHVSWMHLIFNMVTLYCFSSEIELLLGVPKFLLIYFGSLIGGNLFSLYIHRNHYDYSAVGASGAVSGLIFASIALFPGIEIGFVGLPYYIPAWIYGIGYVLYSIYGIKSQKDNVGHDAHLGGGLIGMFLAILMMPSALTNNLLPIALILFPSIIFLYLIIVKPEFLLFNTWVQNKEAVYTFEDKYNLKALAKEQEINQLLDKINRKGFDGLSAKEKQRLKDLTQ